VSENNAKPAARNARYHHGDLRNALIVAACELIEERGSDDFAMIDAARRAGVSSAAPYRHFKDKDELLDAVTVLGFWSLAERSSEILKRCETGSREAIIELGKGYIQFVTQHAPFHGLMWGERQARNADDDPARQLTSGFHSLASAVQAWCNREGISRSEIPDLSLKLWAMTLGLSSLAVNMPLRPLSGSVNLYELLESSTIALLEGARQGVTAADSMPCPVEWDTPGVAPGAARPRTRCAG
jgi:AcrR family transcriptional regulator